MLILTRRTGETLMIGESVAVTVLGVKGNQVRIGISAPADVVVHRKEIHERIARPATAPEARIARAGTGMDGATMPARQESPRPHS